MLGRFLVDLPVVAAFGGTVAAADFDAEAAHARFIDAYNNRQWDEVKAQLAEDSVFHRANATEVYSGPDAIVGHFEQPIGGEWNVKFARLDSEDQLTGNDGRVVERGDFAITAGADDSACYAGSYMMTWAPQGDAWQAPAARLAGRRDRSRELQVSCRMTARGQGYLPPTQSEKRTDSSNQMDRSPRTLPLVALASTRSSTDEQIMAVAGKIGRSRRSRRNRGRRDVCRRWKLL